MVSSTSFSKTFPKGRYEWYSLLARGGTTCFLMPHTPAAVARPATVPIGGVAVPPVAAADLGGPPWAPAAFAQLTAVIAGSTATLAGITATLAGVRDDVTILLHRSSAARVSALRRNSRARDPGHPLVRVPHPDTGALPPAAGFPATLRDFRQLTSAAVNVLSAFYGLPTHQVNLVDRRVQLAEALGCD